MSRDLFRRPAPPVRMQRSEYPARRPAPPPVAPKPEHPVVNPLEYDQTFNTRPFRMWAGHGGTTRFATTTVYIWADSFESAFELLVEYLDEHAPGLLTTFTEDDYKRAAEDMGITWRDYWPDYDDARFERVAQHAEEGYTTIGHTSLQNGTHIESQYWGGDEVTDDDELERLLQYSQAKWRKTYDEEPPR
jgi:hypothetical protein